jgi:choice-of-anchor B domain-containing protein
MKNKVLILLLAIQAIGFSQNSSNVSVYSNWKATSLLNDNSFNTYNEIWGYAANGREFAIIGSILGAHFVDITNPTNPVEVDFELGGASGSFVIHRDYHNYGQYLYAVCDQGNTSSLQIFDMSFLPDSVHKVYDSDTLFTNSHNIFIDTATAKLYVCYARKTGTSLNGNVAIYSLANPTNPTYLGFINETAHDVYVKNDTVYLNNEGKGQYFFDATNPTNIQLLGFLGNYPDKGYNHSGWLDDDGVHYYFADETHGMQMKSVDVTNFSNLLVLDKFGATYSNTSIVHNLISKGDFLYVSHYYDGLRIYNTTDPSNVTVAGYYDTYLGPNAASYKGLWGVYPFLPSGTVIGSDMQEGLFIFDVSLITTGISSNKLYERISVYPNPVRNSINLTNPDQVDLEGYQIFDMKGRMIVSGRLSFGQNQIDLDNGFQEGVYLLKLYNQNESTRIKIVKSGI